MTDRTRKSRQQTKDRIAELFMRGDTQGNAPGSKWAAVNAIVEYGDWMRPLRSSGQRFARALDDGPEKTRALQLVAAVARPGQARRGPRSPPSFSRSTRRRCPRTPVQWMVKESARGVDSLLQEHFCNGYPN